MLPFRPFSLPPPFLPLSLSHFKNPQYLIHYDTHTHRENQAKWRLSLSLSLVIASNLAFLPVRRERKEEEKKVFETLQTDVKSTEEQVDIMFCLFSFLLCLLSLTSYIVSGLDLMSSPSCADQGERDAFADELARILISDPRIEIVNASITGDCQQFGIFQNGSTVTNELIESERTRDPFIDYGVTLSNGFAAYAERSNNTIPGVEDNDPMASVSGVCTDQNNANADVPDLYNAFCANDDNCDRLCDAAQISISFRIVNSSNVTLPLTMSYIFASEEYESSVGHQNLSFTIPIVGYQAVYPQYQDVFAFFIDGENIALAGGGEAVSVQTINAGNPCAFQYNESATKDNFSMPFHPVNEDQFRDNDIWLNDSACLPPTVCPSCVCAANEENVVPGEYATEFNGFTTTLRAIKTDLSVGDVHTMKFVIADETDEWGISQVFIQGRTFATRVVGCTDPNALNYDPTAVEDSAQCTYLPDALTIVVPNEAVVVGSAIMYDSCPFSISYTSTKTLDVAFSLCDAGDTTSCHDLSVGSRNVSASSYDAFDVASVDVTKDALYVLKLTSQDHRPLLSTTIYGQTYDNETVTIATPIDGDTLYGCGTYDVSWTVHHDGWARTSTYDVDLYDDGGQHVENVASNVAIGTTPWIVSSSLADGSYVLKVSSSTLSDTCVPPSYVSIVISQDVPDYVNADWSVSDVDPDTPGVQLRMCRTVPISIRVNAATDVQMVLDDRQLAKVSGPGDTVASSFFTGPDTFASGSNYTINTSVVDPKLAQCLEAESRVVEIVETRITSLAMSQNASWSTVCGQEEGKVYTATWDMSDAGLQYVDVVLCRANDTATCRTLVVGSCSNELVADETFWNDHGDFIADGGEFSLRVGLSSGEDRCVTPVTASLTVLPSRDEVFCPESLSSSAGMSTGDIVSIVVPVLIGAVLVVVAVVLYYKYRIRHTKKKAKDLMVAQEIRHEQDMSAKDLELPETNSKLVFDLPGTEDEDGAMMSQVKTLEKQKRAMSREIARLKKKNETGSLKISKQGSVHRDVSVTFSEKDLVGRIDEI